MFFVFPLLDHPYRRAGGGGDLVPGQTSRPGTFFFLNAYIHGNASPWIGQQRDTDDRHQSDGREAQHRVCVRCYHGIPYCMIYNVLDVWAVVGQVTCKRF